MADQKTEKPAPTPRGKRHLVIHGHFYQPPRENPFLGEIEGEDSAYPHNDWNERITYESYRPLSASRILDSHGRVEEILNCYRLINFNVGPTLFSWMDRHHPDLVSAIVAADVESRSRNNGHGNAIAQVYNHLIMPLANERDQRTQIEWGLADFRRRFGRESESIWLAETAINDVTLNLLIEYGLKYVILSPHQADSVRDPRAGEWHSVVDGSVDPRRPYLLKTKKGSIAAFFYDGGLASAVSFEHLLRSADSLSARLVDAAGGMGDEDILVNVATDGEIYGHHEPFGDMCLSYALSRLLPNQGFEVTNYGNFLEQHPPQWEARLKTGPNGEGTAWSCSHGVGRWYRDCGCSTGGGAGWNQKWRRPLRDSLNTLRDRLAEIYEREGKSLFNDVWKARSEYIKVIQAGGLSEEEQVRQKFLSEHLKEGVIEDKEACKKALSLLESQLNSLLMFTSCGWFFAEVSGIETVQIMKYAARAVEVLSPWVNERLEENFLEGLKKAKSNIPEQENGASCYRRYVMPLKETNLRVANQVVHLHHLSDLKEGRIRQYSYEAELSIEKTVERKKENETIHAGKVALRDVRTKQEGFWRFVIAQFGELRTHAFFVSASPDDGEPPVKEEELRILDLAQLNERIVQKQIGWEMSLQDLIKRERTELTRMVLSERTHHMRDALGELADQNEDLLKLLSETRVPMPPTIKSIFEITLSASVVEAMDYPLDEARRRAQSLRDRAETLGLTLYKDQLIRLLGDRINGLARELAKKKGDLEQGKLDQIADLLELCDLLDAHPDFLEAQDVFYELVRSEGRHLAGQLQDKFDKEKYALLNLLLENALNLNLNVEKEKKMVAPLERRLSEDSALWP